MSPGTAAALAEFRKACGEAEVSIVEDHGERVLVFVDPTDLEPFYLVIDPWLMLTPPVGEVH